MQNSGEPFCLEMEAIKLNGKTHSSSSFMRISFQWYTIWIKFKKKSDFSKFYKYFTSIAVKSILLRNAVFIVLFHLIQFPSWNKTMLSTWIFITNTSMILPPLSIKKKLFSKWNGRHCQELIIWIHFFALTQKLCYIQVVRLLFALVFKPWKKQEVSPLTT